MQAAQNDTRQILIAAEAAEAARTASTATDEAIRRDKYQHAINLYQQLTDEFQVRNGGIFYNVGNAYAALGDYPHAILNYRRAQLYAPNDAELIANLQLVRGMRKDHFKEPEATRILKTLFFWHYDTSFAFRFKSAAFFAALFWIAATLLLWYRRCWLKYTTIALLVLALAPAVSAAITACSIRNMQPAVIMADEAMPRKGAAQSYAPAFDKPLHAGAEVNIIKKQGEWVEIAIPGNLTGWLHESTLEDIIL